MFLRGWSIEVSGDSPSKAVKALDDATGFWLAYLGYMCYTGIELCRSNIDKAIDVSVEVAGQELENLLGSRRSPRYIDICQRSLYLVAQELPTGAIS